jgi:hypothetical protein
MSEHRTRVKPAGSQPLLANERPASDEPNPEPQLIDPLRPTSVYDTYRRLAAERQVIFFRRIAGKPAPWTQDPVLQKFKFTNAYRASDRVSQYLIRNVICREDLPTSTNELDR